MRKYPNVLGPLLVAEMEAARKAGEKRRLLVVRPEGNYRVTIEPIPAAPPYEPPEPEYLYFEETVDVDWKSLMQKYRDFVAR